VAYGCSLDELLGVLRDRAAAKVEAVVLQRRRVEHGLLSVGLKVHCLSSGGELDALVDDLGGEPKVLARNMYKHARASLCLVLPPVGNARAAILLLECIECFTGIAFFGNPKIQFQVCSPGRLDARRSALLGTAFYLGSDTLRRYACGDLETTVSNGKRYQRGERLVIYDAGGDFDRDFEWWDMSGIDTRVIRHRLPFENGRSDLLVGSGSGVDIENINLLATLLVHAQYHGYWRTLGEEFEEDMRSLLDRHLLAGLVDAPWVRTEDAESADDFAFFAALQELVTYAFEESVRVKRMSRNLFSRRREIPGGILCEMQALLNKYRAEVATQSSLPGSTQAKM
jgi:hypothetical protein